MGSFYAHSQAWRDTVDFSENTILPSTLVIQSDSATLSEGKDYQLILGTGKVAFAEAYDSNYRVTFVTLSWNLTEDQYALSRDLIQENIQSNQARPTRTEIPTVSDPFSGLARSGSISRSLSVGNAQDAVLQSQLNLQLSGNIGGNTILRASISDQNLPVQPEGTTQTLREFDRVFIELENPDFGKIVAGDFVLGNRKSTYASFDKKLSGALVASPIAIGDEDTLLVRGVGALARGQFARNEIRGQEGNQGPYRLSGNRNEVFIIVLSGSERVYIDGVPLTRGQDKDYIIDYNTGEITFTPLRPITKDKRIIVEFQYTEQSYVRTMAFGEVAYKSKKSKNSLQFYSEQDNKNQPLFGEFTDAEKAALAAAGDDPLKAVVPGWTETAFEPGRLLYEIVDSLGVDTVFVLSPDGSGSPLYEVQFAYVGPGLGDYVIDPAGANGRVFRWVPPVNGEPQGSYIPAKVLPRPGVLQVLALDGELDVSKNQKITYHGGWSRKDPNTFSDLNADNQTGLAGKLGYAYGNINKGWNAGFSVEHVDSSFSTIERFREVEFSRNWNLPVGVQTQQQTADAHLGYRASANQWGKYQFQYLGTGEGFVGTKHNAGGKYQDKNWDIDFAGSWLSTEQNGVRTEFLRQKSRVRRNLFSSFYTGLWSEAELNASQNDSVALTTGSYRFLEGDFFVGIGDSSSVWVELSAGLRNDDTARVSDFSRQAQAEYYRIKSIVRSKTWGRWYFYGQYRELENDFNPNRNQQTTTGRIDFSHRFFKNSLQLNSLYQVGVGSEPIREYRYIPVPAGTGTHTWRDYNNNGIQELDEFELAQFPDEATFLRTFILGNQLLPTSEIQFSQLVRWDPKRVFSARWIGLFSFQVQYANRVKSLFTSSQNDLDPFAARPDSSVVSQSENFRGSVFLNRANPKWGGEYTYLQNEQINNQSYGLESGSQQEHQLRSRYQFISNWEVRLDYVQSTRTNSAFLLSSRNYKIQRQTLSPRLIFQPGPQFSITLQSDIKAAVENELMQDLQSASGGLQVNWNRGGKWNVTASGEWVDVTFAGDPNNASGYAMLEGLQPGANALWQTQFQFLLNSFLQLNVQYNGRTSTNSPIIHTGTLQIKAFF
ncbi:MAG: hypothetical protein SchgKO_00620 [Schleiferiaceae bacterium]